MRFSTICTVLFYPYITHERTIQNLDFVCSLIVLFLIERHRYQNQGSLKSEEGLSDFKERCAQLCKLDTVCGIFGENSFGQILLLSILCICLKSLLVNAQYLPYIVLTLFGKIYRWHLHKLLCILWLKTKNLIFSSASAKKFICMFIFFNMTLVYYMYMGLKSWIFICFLKFWTS